MISFKNFINEAQKTKDMKGIKCTKCEKGTYQETGMHDDMDGVVHCTKCGHGTKRHLPVPHNDIRDLYKSKTIRK